MSRRLFVLMAVSVVVAAVAVKNDAKNDDRAAIAAQEGFWALLIEQVQAQPPPPPIGPVVPPTPVGAPAFSTTAGTIGGLSTGGPGGGGCAGSSTTLCVSGFGFGNASWSTIVGSIVNMLRNSILAVSAAVFVVGAWFFAISAGDEGRKTRGKDLMIYALVGTAVVIGAQGVFNTVLYFLYG